MDQDGRERRKHNRYVVEGLIVHLGPEVLDIIDISSEAVRIVRPQSVPGENEAVPFHIRNNKWGEPVDMALTGRIIRAAPAFVVLRYPAPGAEWENFLRRHDTFERVALGPIAI